MLTTEVFADEMIQRCCRDSERIRTYLDNETYLTEVGTSELITAGYLKRLILYKFVGELQEIGINTNQEVEDVLLLPQDLEIVFLLHEQLTGEHWLAVLQRLSEEQQGQLRQLLENTRDEELLTELILFLVRELPLSTVWQQLQYALDYWYSDELFAKHLQASLDALRPPAEPELTAEELQAYRRLVQYLVQCRQQLSRMVREAAVTLGTVDTERALRLVQDYGKLATQQPWLDRWLHYNDDDDNEQWLPEYRRLCWYEASYWQQRSTVPSKEQLLVLGLVLRLEQADAQQCRDACSCLQALGEEYSEALTRVLELPVTGDDHE